MKHQIIIIHGGNAYRTYKEYLAYMKSWRIDFDRYRTSKPGWKATLGKALGPKFEVIRPDMPNDLNAQYIEWKIWFEKFIPHLKPGVVLIGHSLGGVFLAKFLSENKFPKNTRATFLVSPPYSEASFSAPKSYKKLIAQGGKIFIYHSKDDKVVPFVDFKKYQKKLPGATTRVFKDRGHFNQPKIPELVKDIRGLF